jgi:hypothetical protein
MDRAKPASWRYSPLALPSKLQSNRKEPDMITITLTEQEVQTLAGLLDAGVKAIGLRAVKDAAALLAKLEEATQPKETSDE